MLYKNIIIESDNGIVTITINRPEALNALNREVLSELDHYFFNEAIAAEIAGIIITGSGERAFVAGADIKEFLSLDQEKAEAMGRKVHRLFSKIEQFRKPVIAAINGFALGGGCELAMACHMRIAGSKARFGQPEVNLGILPGYGGTQRLVQLIGKGKALEMMLTAEMIGAEEARSLGLVNHVVEAGQEINKAKEIIMNISTKSPLAVGEVISTVNAFFDKTKNGFEEEIKAFGRLSVTADFREGASAFVQKRKAEWKGR
ncbi:MAG: enoyl-CoA hydratase-related protein [Saprospiraceae bacterium]